MSRHNDHINTNDTIASNSEHAGSNHFLSKFNDTNHDKNPSRNAWPEDADIILENIRLNSIILSDYHKKQYFLLLSLLKYFRIPIIIISAFASVLNIGLQPFLDQEYISIICCMLSLITGLIGSIELFLQVQKKMENELMNSRDFYLNAIDIYKVLSLEPEHRNGDGLKYLDGKFAMYCKMIENSNVLDKAIQDQLAPIDIGAIERISSGNNSRNGDNERIKSPKQRISIPADNASVSNSWYKNGFFSYFFNRPTPKLGFEHVGMRRESTLLRRTNSNTTNDGLPSTPMVLTRSDDDNDSISSSDRFEIYCKLINKHNDIEPDIMNKLTPILSNKSSYVNTMDIEERVKIYSHLLEHVKVIGSKELLDKLKVILIGNFFKSNGRANAPIPALTMETRFDLVKSLLEHNLEPEMINKIKQLLLKDIKRNIQQNEGINQEMLDVLLSLPPTQPSDAPRDLESGMDLDEVFLSDDHPIGTLTPLGRHP